MQFSTQNTEMKKKNQKRKNQQQKRTTRQFPNILAPASILMARRGKILAVIKLLCENKLNIWADYVITLKKYVGLLFNLSLVLMKCRPEFNADARVHAKIAALSPLLSH